MNMSETMKETRLHIKHTS